MVFLAAGAGGRGSVVLTAARACDDGAAINNFMEAPTPELSLLFPHAPYSLSPIHSTPLAIPAPLILVPRSHFSVLPCSAVCTGSPVSVLSSASLHLLLLHRCCLPPLPKCTLPSLTFILLHSAHSILLCFSLPWVVLKLLSYFIHSLNHEMFIRH